MLNVDMSSILYAVSSLYTHKPLGN